MLKEFNKVCDMILESSDELTKDLENTDIKPTCCYCGKEVSIDIYEKQKEWHETQMDDFFKKNNIQFNPKDCVCKKCSDKLSKIYSSGNKWTGD